MSNHLRTPPPPPVDKPDVRTYRRTNLGDTGDVTEHHVITVRLDPNGYVLIHGDTLIPLIRQAGYTPDPGEAS